MIPKWLALRFHLIFILVIFACKAMAQPTLPDMSGSSDKGLVILNWNCQYNGIKTITVLHSNDSVKDFTPIGKVKTTEKGLQFFVDGHPVLGKNYYKLAIQFTSGLKWNSNFCKVKVDKTIAESHPPLPSNDSLQKLIITENKPSVTKEVVKNDPGLKTQGVQYLTKQNKPEPKQTKISITFDADTININSVIVKDEQKPIAHRPKITITFDDPDSGTPIFINSQYITADPVSGQIYFNLPDDVSKHHYSVKFYDPQNHMVIEVQKINASKLIMDRKNFQQKGIYKFILRRDVVELGNRIPEHQLVS